MSSQVINASSRTPQVDDAGRLKHFLTIEGLDKAQLLRLLDAASAFIGANTEKQKEQASLLESYLLVEPFDINRAIKDDLVAPTNFCHFREALQNPTHRVKSSAN